MGYLGYFVAMIIHDYVETLISSITTHLPPPPPPQKKKCKKCDDGHCNPCFFSSGTGKKARIVFFFQRPQGYRISCPYNYKIPGNVTSGVGLDPDPLKLVNFIAVIQLTVV